MLRYGILPGFALLGFSVAVMQLPLFNYLGYEFSASIALAIPWLSGFLTISWLAKHSSTARNGLTPERYVDFLLRSFGHNFLLLCIPFAAITANAAFVRNCSYEEGIAFYILIPLVTAVFSSALAGFCWVLAPRRSRLLYVALVLGTLVYSLYLGLRMPQIYSYNFIYGFFLGFSYDEVLTISDTLVLFRLITLMAALLLILLGAFFLRYNQRIDRVRTKLASLVQLAKVWDIQHAAIIGLGGVLIAAWFFRVELGFESPTYFIQHTLGARYASEHFRIYYSPRSFTIDEIRSIALEHEFQFARVKDALRAESDEVIDSYIYPDTETKLRLIGTGSTNIAKPWRREMHLNKESWEATLKHELVHVEAGEFGMPIIRAHYNIGLVEGLATAVAGGYGNRTLHEYARAMQVFGIITDPAPLLSAPGFITQQSSVSYVMMGSFCKFLIDRYGIASFKELYGGGFAETIYHKPYATLIGEWQKQLARISVPASWKRHVEFYFKRPSIFAKECARAIAEMNEEGWRLLEENTPDAAMNIFSSSLATSWNTEAFSGLVRSAYHAERYDTLIQLMDTQLQDSVGRKGSLSLLRYYGDALWYRDSLEAARKAYENVAALDLSTAYNEGIAVRLAAMDDTLLRGKMAEFLVGNFSYRRAVRYFEGLDERSDNPLIPYLLGRLHLRQRKFDDAIRLLEDSTTAFENTMLEVSRLEMLGEAYLERKEYEKAREYITDALTFTKNEASREVLAEWLERCGWFEKNEKKVTARLGAQQQPPQTHQ